MTELLPDPTATMVVGFTVLPMIVAALVVAGLLRTSGRRTAGVGAGLFTLWLALTGGLATLGFFDAWAPPRMGLVFGTVLAIRGRTGFGGPDSNVAQRLGPLRTVRGVNWL